MTEQNKNQRFKEMVLPHLNAAYNLARWLTRNDQDAEDVTQEAFLRAFKFFDSFRGEQGRAWLLGIVRNTCYTRLQKDRGRELNTLFDEESHSLESQGPDMPHDNPESILSRHQNFRKLNGALERLPVEFRETVVLKDLEDLSYKEIAEVTAVPLGTVMSRLARGRKLLRVHLAQMKQGDSDGM
jgi:RNA polymerase sigma-70 factor (ECF subfamily)